MFGVLVPPPDGGRFEASFRPAADPPHYARFTVLGGAQSRIDGADLPEELYDQLVRAGPLPVVVRGYLERASYFRTRRNHYRITVLNVEPISPQRAQALARAYIGNDVAARIYRRMYTPIAVGEARVFADVDVHPEPHSNSSHARVWLHVYSARERPNVPVPALHLWRAIGPGVVEGELIDDPYRFERQHGADYRLTYALPVALDGGRAVLARLYFPGAGSLEVTAQVEKLRKRDRQELDAMLLASERIDLERARPLLRPRLLANGLGWASFEGRVSRPIPGWWWRRGELHALLFVDGTLRIYRGGRLLRMERLIDQEELSLPHAEQYAEIELRGLFGLGPALVSSISLTLPRHLGRDDCARGSFKFNQADGTLVCQGRAAVCRDGLVIIDNTYWRNVLRDDPWRPSASHARATDPFRSLHARFGKHKRVKHCPLPSMAKN